jgi:hypothetical protein
MNLFWVLSNFVSKKKANFKKGLNRIKCFNSSMLSIYSNKEILTHIALNIKWPIEGEQHRHVAKPSRQRISFQ